VNLWLRVFEPFAAGYYFSYLLRNVNAVIAPDLSRDLGLSAADLGLLTSAYLLAFGAFQLPLGLLLDRYGPRRVEAALLVVAALGCCVFALAPGAAGLVFGRGLIGLGVSSCLMASFKAFSQWFPRQRQASLNAAVMAAGGLGALTATVPLSWALLSVGWRGVFLGLAACVLLIAGGILTTPEQRLDRQGERLSTQLRTLAEIFGSRVFWRFAPQAAMLVGGFMAIQGLWAVPLLINVNGETQAGAAFHLLLTSGAMLIGFVTIATLVTPLQRRGISLQTILAVGTGLGLADLAAIVAGVGDSHVLWFGLGLFFAVGNLAYALLSSHFPLALAGRVNTALNLLTFAGAFVLQWGFGVLVDHLAATGMPLHQAYQWTLGLLLCLQLTSFAWFVTGGRRKTGVTGR